MGIMTCKSTKYQSWFPGKSSRHTKNYSVSKMPSCITEVYTNAIGLISAARNRPVWFYGSTKRLLQWPIVLPLHQALVIADESTNRAASNRSSTLLHWVGGWTKVIFCINARILRQSQCSDMVSSAIQAVFTCGKIFFHSIGINWLTLSFTCI